jgi:phosphohistidine phosphatase
MARRLILMRHARQGGMAATDHDRRLTREGHLQARRVGRRLASLGPIPDRVLASTALRCRETWSDMAVALPTTIDLELEADLYNATAERLLDAIAAVDEAVGTLLVLAHNPGISLLALGLAGSREAERDRLLRGFSPATTAVFEVADAWATLSPRTARLQSFAGPDEADDTDASTES